MTDESTDIRIFLEQKVAAQQCGGLDLDDWPADPTYVPLRCPRCGWEVPVRAERCACGAKSTRPGSDGGRQDGNGMPQQVR